VVLHNKYSLALKLFGIGFSLTGHEMVSRKAYADFQKRFRDNKFRPGLDILVRGLVTHDWHDVGNGYG